MGKTKQWWHDNWFDVVMFGLRTLGTVGMIFGAYVGAKKGVEEAFDINRLEVTICKDDGETKEELPVVEVSEF